MKATVVDLRYRMKEVLKALERNEDVSILYHGKPKAVIKAHARQAARKVAKHPFFNMNKKKDSVGSRMDKLRGGRYVDL
jgi:antitoxin (DNA-binding transcriptional repressor) of toxin-antitoxin stability system